MQGIIKYYLPMSNDFLSWVYSEMNRRGWRNSDLARRSGLSGSTISRVFSGERLPSWDFCAGVARAFNLRAEEVFRIAGLLPSPPQESAEEEELIYHFRNLSPDLHQAALYMMRGLRQGMTGHYTFVPADENAMDAACLRAMERLADEGNLIEVARKIQGNTSRRQKLGIDRKLNQLDAEDEARCDAEADLGGSRTS